MYDELVKRLNVFRLKEDEYQSIPVYVSEIIGEAADAIEELSMKLHGDEAAIAGMKREIERMVVYGNKPKWIPVTERLPKVEKDVLVAFPHNQAVAYMLDDGRWEVVSGDGWSTDINIAGGEKIPTHWMPLPQPPKGEEE